MRLAEPGRSVGFLGVYSWLSALVALLVMTSASVAQFAEPVTWVEEDWELVLVEPDGDILAPQFHSAMSPYSHIDNYYMQVTWNYWEIPEFAGGGYQVQGWEGEEVIRLKSLGSEEFDLSAETVSWTQVMAVFNNSLWYAIVDGESVTWGSFGGLGTVIGGMTGVTSLDGYSPDVSVENSWVTYGANRISSLKITEVRYYGASGWLYTDTTPRVIHESE